MSDQLSFDSGSAPRPNADAMDLFFAILPALAAATQPRTDLARRLRDEHGLRGKPLATERLHVSLLGLGEYAGPSCTGIVAVASEAAADGCGVAV